MIIPDPFKKTIKIPVRIVDGKAEYFYGGPFPKIRDVTGDLVVPAFSVMEKSFVDEFSANDGAEILPRGTSLMVNVWADSGAPGLVKDVQCGPLSGNVEVQLWEPLYLWHRGTKNSVLAPCKCFIPALNERASSLNHAYTIVSKAFETKRQTNTGNVFKKIYYRGGVDSWHMLQRLRDKFDAQFEQRFIANRRQGTSVVPLADSGVIDQSVLWEDYEGRMVASIDRHGLTIDEHDYSDNDRQDVRQTVKTGSLHKVLFELMKERFTSAVEFDAWLDKKGISADLRTGLPTVNKDPFVELLKVLNEVSADEQVGLIESAASLFTLRGDGERRVVVDEQSYKLLDEFLASGWIRVGGYLKRRPLFPSKSAPRRNIPIRIRLEDFSFSKQQRRVLRKNADVKIDVRPLSIAREDEELFDRHRSRINGTPPRTIYDVIPISSLTEIKKVTITEDDRLLAVSYLDVGKTSTYSIYGIFEPTIVWRSLGILSILKEIEFSIYEGKEFYYLGFVYDGPSNYDYKKRFRGAEYFDWKGNWVKADA